VSPEPRFVLQPAATPGALPLWLVSDAGLAQFLAERSATERAWLASHDFKPERGRVLLLPAADGRAAMAVGGLGTPRAGAQPAFDPWLAALFADRLPAGTYALASTLPPEAATQFALGWLMGQYRFSRYRKSPSSRTWLVEPRGADVAFALACAESLALARDLINTPPNDLGPAELAAAAARIAAETGGECRITLGDALREQFPLVDAVGGGAASAHAPRLIELEFARPGAPRVTLVGKGVCFDTGGLDIKPSSGMLLMKKDMGGAACILALTLLLRRMNAPVALRVLIPAVENSVDAASFRPSDVYRSRKGLTVEIGNTDAEGRLVLADALAAGGEDAPDLLIDFATLTGAARVALGAELPPVFSGDPALATQLQACGAQVGDPLWPLPLWDGYDDELSSRVADLGNVSSSGMAGAIIGALFLRRFVADPSRWLHVDLYGWNARERPGRPVGAEAHAVRAAYALIRQRFG